MITIVNYGLGNIHAFVDIYRRFNLPVRVATSSEELEGSERLILPGVGAFDWAMGRLNASGMRPTLGRLVLQQRVPVLGVCVGMQMMAHGSEEGTLPGLGWIPGHVRRFEEATAGRKIQLPHMGWNDVRPRSTDSLFAGGESFRFYFLHSYYFVPEREEHVLAETDYNGIFASAVCSRNVFGTQFHPEKSHHWGSLLLRNFAGL